MDTETGGGQGEGHMKMKAEIGVIVHRPRSPKRASSQQELGRGWGRVSLTANRRNQFY